MSNLTLLLMRNDAGDTDVLVEIKRELDLRLATHLIDLELYNILCKYYLTDEDS